MSINFFETSCQETNLASALFGLCDDQNGAKAYTDTNEPAKWIATVQNPNNRNLTFTAIDKCIIKDGELIGRGRCDCMLTSDNLIYFIELKNRIPPWESAALEQLNSTIELFKENHDINFFKHKKVFACNKNGGGFQVFNGEQYRKFFDTHSVRLEIQCKIVIK